MKTFGNTFLSLPLSVFVSASFPLSRKCCLQARNYLPLTENVSIFQLNHYLQCQNSALWDCHVTFNLAFYWLIWTRSSMLEPHWWTCIVLLQTKIFQLVKRRDNYFSGWYCLLFDGDADEKTYPIDIAIFIFLVICALLVGTFSVLLIHKSIQMEVWFVTKDDFPRKLSSSQKQVNKISPLLVIGCCFNLIL